jgi:hypothetical protein
MNTYTYNPAAGYGEHHTLGGLGLSSGKYNPVFWQHVAMMERLRKVAEADRLQREEDRRKRQAEWEAQQRRRRAEQEARRRNRRR